MLDNKRREIQLLAGKHWLDAGCIGSLEINTSIGKTWISLDAMLTLEKGSKVLFLAETTQRKKDLYDDIKKYNEIFNTDILNHIKLEFACYQSAYRWYGRYWDLVICDEIHISCSPQYVKFYYFNDYEKLLGLSATLHSKKKYEIGTQEYTKMQLLNEIAPVAYVYDIGDAQKDKSSRALNIHIINHQLDMSNMTIPFKIGKKEVNLSENLIYRYLHDKVDEYQSAGRFKLARLFVSKRCNFLYSLPSKIKATKYLLENVKGKSIIFGNHIDSLEEVTSNVVRSNRSKESKRLRDELNKQIREDFDNDVITTIGSFNILVQGANLNKVDNVILMSYYSEQGRFIQQAGRLRKHNNKVGNVYLFVTKDTQEETWFASFTSQIPMEEFNVMYYNDINEIKFE